MGEAADGVGQPAGSPPSASVAALKAKLAEELARALQGFLENPVATQQSGKPTAPLNDGKLGPRSKKK